ncbi:MAG TPA: response regulator [Sphingobium sp.]
MRGGAPDSMVIFVDDDVSMREALKALAESIGLAVRVHGSVQEYLDSPRPDLPCCLVLDVRMPGRSGLDLQAELARQGDAPPIIFLTGHGDVPMTVRAMKAGAMEFLVKPFRDQDLIDAIHQGIASDRKTREKRAEKAKIRKNRASLTARECEVMDQVVRGLLNKQIAGNLGLSEITVKVHRGQVMRKMGARSVAELVRMADALAREPSA